MIFAKLSPTEQLLADKTSPLDFLTHEVVRIKNGDKTLLYEILIENYSKAPTSTSTVSPALIAGIQPLKDIIKTNSDTLFEIAYSGRNSVILLNQDVPQNS